jgi:lipoate---protein ligase
MKCIIQESDDPIFTLAAEEYLLKNSSEEYFILAINRSSVIIGKHQSPHKEVNTKLITENRIPVLRRISGGGTVYHDPGNLNFSFITNSTHGKQVDFRKYTQPVILFLASLGLETRLGDKNELRLGDYKISGNAEHIHKTRVLHHGTLLFDTASDMLRNSIRKDKKMYSSLGVESNPSDVINLKEKLPQFSDIAQFRSGLMTFIIDTVPGAVPFGFTEEIIKESWQLSEKKYKTWEWNWAYGPDYSFTNDFTVEGIGYNCKLFVREGIITDCNIVSGSTILPLSERLLGCRHMVADVADVIGKYSNQWDMDTIFNLF